MWNQKCVQTLFLTLSDGNSKDVALLSLIVIVQQSSSFVFVWLCIVLRCLLLLSLFFGEQIREPLLAATGLLHGKEKENEVKMLTLKEISRFSPPQMSIPVSYVPICSK